MMHISRLFTAALGLLASAVLFPVTGHAASSDWAKTDTTQLRIISQTDAAGGAQTLTLGLHFKLQDHWKIYWRSPGDAGFPPDLTWKGSSNVQDAKLSWPLPSRFSISGFETLGYTDEVVLPLTVTLERPGQDTTLNAQISYLACAEICVPYDAALSLNLPAGPATPSADAHLINRFASLVPRTDASTGMRIETAQFKVDPASGDKAGTLYLSAANPAGFAAPDAFIEGPDGMAFGKPKVSLSTDKTTAVLEIGFDGLHLIKQPFDQSSLTVTLADGQRGAEMAVTPASATADTLALMNAQPATMPEGPSIWLMLAIAVLGGMILNLMPCVLPVLSIKLLGVVGHGGAATHTVRASFLASAAGIIASFLALAAVLLVLKSAGLAIGWGIQFQHPWFLVAMALIVTLFACNLWGFFEVHLPEAVNEIGATTVHEHSLGGHFLTGALATLLATPCSAPFLGTAVGFALARGTVEILAIFAALGVGLALPFLLVAIYPKLATKMPKPGNWMIVLRRILGFALAATAVWLVSILAIQVSQMAAILIGAILGVVALTLYIHKRLHHRYGRMDWIAVGILAVLAFAVPDNVNMGADQDAKSAKLHELWQPFDKQAIRTLVSDGQVVFVDVTAEWCITCQVNKAVVIADEAVYSRLQSSGTVAMQADWTRPDPAITQYLSSFGRYGIPFNAVYGPGAPDGIALPELLTQSAVLEALDKAGGGAMAMSK